MRGAALLVCAGALAATVRGPPALEGALVQPAEDGDGPRHHRASGTRLLLSPSGDSYTMIRPVRSHREEMAAQMAVGEADSSLPPYIRTLAVRHAAFERMSHATRRSFMAARVRGMEVAAVDGSRSARCLSLDVHEIILNGVAITQELNLTNLSFSLDFRDDFLEGAIRNDVKREELSSKLGEALA